MKQRILGRTGLNISEVGFGAWAIGGTSYGPTDDKVSLQALETAWENGVNFYDTADTYGHGRSESLICGFLKGRNRREVIFAFKAGWDFYNGPSRKRFDAEYVRFACEKSLERLGTDYIDLYQFHNPSLELIRQGEIFELMEELQAEGKIRFIGVSIHRAEEALACMDDGRVDALQVIFNLLDQRMIPAVFPAALEKKIGILAREPLACGLLTGKYDASHRFTKDDHRNRWVAEKREADARKVDLIRELLKDHSAPLAQSALEFILAQKAVSTVIPGAKTPEQVEQNVKASLEPQLSENEAVKLEELYQTEPVFREALVPK